MGFVSGSSQSRLHHSTLDSSLPSHHQGIRIAHYVHQHRPHSSPLETFWLIPIRVMLVMHMAQTNQREKTKSILYMLCPLMASTPDHLSWPTDTIHRSMFWIIAQTLFFMFYRLWLWTGTGHQSIKQWQQLFYKQYFHQVTHACRWGKASFESVWIPSDDHSVLHFEKVKPVLPESWTGKKTAWDVLTELVEAS